MFERFKARRIARKLDPDNNMGLADETPESLKELWDISRRILKESKNHVKQLAPIVQANVSDARKLLNDIEGYLDAHIGEITVLTTNAIAAGRGPFEIDVQRHGDSAHLVSAFPSRIDEIKAYYKDRYNVTYPQHLNNIVKDNPNIGDRYFVHWIVSAGNHGLWFCTHICSYSDEEQKIAFVVANPDMMN